MGEVNYWQGRPVLVTGAAGFLGQWLVKALRERGAVVTGFDIGDYYEDNVCNQERVEDVLQGETPIEVVFHLAAQTIVGIANRNPAATLRTNVQGTVSVLEACRRCPTVKRIIVASSDKAYGTADKLPYTEDTPLRGRYPYDASKACADLIAQSYMDTFKMPIAITRCANLYGGGDLHWSRLIPGTIRSIIRGERPVIRSDGTMIRDYLYVEDAVEGYLRLAESKLTGAFNFGGHPWSVLHAVRAIAFVMGVSHEPEVLGTASNEIQSQTLQTYKAYAGLNQWTPRQFHDGLVPTIAWYREYLK